MATKKEVNARIKEEYPCMIEAKDVFTLDKTRVHAKLGGIELSRQEKINLQNEVKFFNESRLKNILMDTIYDMARKVMFERSETFDDMLQGKMMLYNISVQKNILQSIENMRIDSPNSILQHTKKTV